MDCMPKQVSTFINYTLFYICLITIQITDIVVVQEYVELLSDVHPILVDILVDPSATLADDEDKKQNINFPEYISSTQMNEGLKVIKENNIIKHFFLYDKKTGRLHQGRIRMARGGFSEAFVSSGTMDHDILIQGPANLNRVVDGDILIIYYLLH